MSGEHKVDPFERENRLMKVAAMYLQGMRQIDIAGALSVTQQQVSYDVKALQKRWQKSALVDINEAKGKELARIDELEVEYWQEWQRSKRDKNKSRKISRMKSRPYRRKGKDGEEPLEYTDTERETEVIEEKEELLGNTSYLDGIQWCIAQRCKILGLYAPVKTSNEHSGPNGGPIQTQDTGDKKKLPLSFYEVPPSDAQRVAAILLEVGAVSEPSDDEAPT